MKWRGKADRVASLPTEDGIFAELRTGRRCAQDREALRGLTEDGILAALRTEDGILAALRTEDGILAALRTEDGIFAALRTGRRFAPDGGRDLRCARDRGPKTDDGVVISYQIERSFSQTVIASEAKRNPRANNDASMGLRFLSKNDIARHFKISCIARSRTLPRPPKRISKNPFLS